MFICCEQVYVFWKLQCKIKKYQKLSWNSDDFLTKMHELSNITHKPGKSSTASSGGAFVLLRSKWLADTTGKQAVPDGVGKKNCYPLPSLHLCCLPSARSLAALPPQFLAVLTCPWPLPGSSHPRPRPHAGTPLYSAMQVSFAVAVLFINRLTVKEVLSLVHIREVDGCVWYDVDACSLKNWYPKHKENPRLLQHPSAVVTWSRSVPAQTLQFEGLFLENFKSRGGALLHR